jgi:PAS domain S-box-containing protein
MHFIADYVILADSVSLDTGEMIIVILSAILIGFNYLFGFFYAVFSYDPFISSNGLATHSCLFQVFTFFYHAILSPLIAFMDDTNSAGWAFVVVSLVILGLRHISLIRSFPFYHYWPMKYSLIFSAICVTISIVNLVASFSKSSLLFTSKVVYLEAWLVPLAIKLTSTQFSRTILKYQSIANKDLKSKEDVFKKIFGLKYVTSNPQFTINNEAKRNSGEIRFWGILGQNEKNKGFGSVSNLNHILKSSSNLNIPKEDFDAGDVSKHYSELITILNRRVLQESTENFKHNQQLKIIFAHLALTYAQVPSAYIIHQAGFDKISGMTGITAIRFKEKLNTSIHEFFSQNRGKVLDLQSYIKLEELSDIFSQMIQKNSKKTIDFWQSYAESQVSVKNLNLKSRVLEKEADDIAYFWRRCALNQKAFTKQVGSLYSMYLSVIRNTPYLAHKILQSYSTGDLYHHYANADSDDPLSEDTLLSSNILAFYVALPKDRQGKITYVTSSLTENLGWNQNEVLGHNINMVMPNFMKDQHDQIIARHSKGQSDGTANSKMYKNLESFVLEKSGNILPCDVYISIHPHIQTIPVYIALVKPKKTLGDQIILNDEGIIEGFTKNVGKNFGLTFNGRANIKSICKDYSELSHAMQNVNSMHRIQTKEHMDTASRRSRSDAPTVRSIKSAKSIYGQVKQNRFSMRASVPDTTFTMEFLVYNNEDSKIKTKEPIPYTVRISSHKFGEIYYYVLNLEQQTNRIEDEKFFNNDPQRSFLEHPSFMNPEGFSEMMFDICDERTVPEQDTASPLPALPMFGSASTRYAKNDMQKKAIMNAQNSEYRNLKSMVPQPSEPLRNVSLMINSQNRDFEHMMSTVTQNRELNRGGDGYYPLESKDYVHQPTTITKRNDEGGDDISWINRSNSLQKNKDPSKAFGRLKSQDHENWEGPMEEKKNDALRIVELGHQAASSVGTSFKAEMVKLEQAVVLVPKNINLGILHLVVLGFIVLLTAPLLAFAIRSQTVIDLVQSSVEVISMSIFRLVRITDMTQYVREYFEAQIGMLAPDRYADLGYTDTVEDIASAQLLKVCADLNDRNNQLRDFVYKLDDQLQQKIYQDEIWVNELNDEGEVVADRTANTFDIITELVSQSTSLVTSGVPTNYQNAYLMFILNNTYNDLLVASAQTVPILVEDNDAKLQTQVDYIIYSMSILAVATLFVAWFFYTITRNFIKDRNQFISILFALEREPIDKHLMIMNKFVSMIDKSKTDGRKINLAASIETFLNYSTQKLKDDKFKKKASANVGGINKILILLNFSMIALVVMMYSSYIALLAFMTNGNQAILAKVDLLTQSNLNLYKLNSLATSIYEYIQENITTEVRNTPIKEDYEETFKEATKAQDFILYDLLDTTNGVGNNAVLVEIATGDLCSNIKTDDENLAKLCTTMGGGVALNGLIGLNSFTLASMKTVKDYYDYSNRTYQAQVAALSLDGLIDVEIFYPFTYSTYQYIDSLLKSQLSDDFSAFKQQILEIIIAYTILSYLVGIYLWVRIKRTFEFEMASWRKMLRQIPQGLIATNKRLRRYLAQNSDGILSARS